MVYQNNNNRIVPKAVEDRTLKPAATATDKTIKYQIDTTEANKWVNTANSLAALGKGLMEMDTLWKYQSQENAIKAIWETEAQGGNKKDWSEVSKRIKGAGIFNPYNDNAFRILQAQDIQRAAVSELLATPEIEKLDEPAFNKLVSDTNQKMMEAFKQTGLHPADYGISTVQFNNQVKALTNKYIIENRKYKYDQLCTKETSDTTVQISSALMDAEDGTESIALRQVLDNKIAHLNDETGIVAPDTQAKVILGGLKNYIARNADQIDDAEVLAAISDLRLGNGQSLQEVLPNYDIMVKDLLSQAREAQLRQMKLEVEVQDFQQQQKIREVMTDFMDKYTKGDISSPEAMQAYAKDMVEKYGLDGMNSMKMFQELAVGRKTWTDLSEIESDPRVKANIGTKVILGTATYEEIANAMSSGRLSTEDGLRLMQNLQTREQKIQSDNDKRVEKHIKDATKEYLEGTHTGDSEIDAKLLDPDSQTFFQQEMKRLYEEYQTTHDYKKFNDDLAYLKSDCKQAELEQSKGIRTQQALKEFENISQRTPTITQQQYARVDFNKDTQALRKMGLVHTSFGNKDGDVGIASKPSTSRTITVTNAQGQRVKKTARHTGYDLKGGNVYYGRDVYSPMKGAVVAVRTGYNGGMGNSVLILCENGKLVKYMHLQDTNLPSVGQKVNEKTPIGKIGSTGAVSNKAGGSLHVEFYDQNQQWITAAQFMNK